MQKTIEYLFYPGIDRKLSEEIKELEQKGFKFLSGNYQIRGEDSYDWISKDKATLSEALGILSEDKFRGFYVDDHPGGAPSGFIHYSRPSSRLTLEDSLGNQVLFAIRGSEKPESRIKSFFSRIFNSDAEDKEAHYI